LAALQFDALYLVPPQITSLVQSSIKPYSDKSNIIRNASQPCICIDLIYWFQLLSKLYSFFYFIRYVGQAIPNQNFPIA